MATTEVRKRGTLGRVFLYVFYGFNVLMLWWLISYWADVGPSLQTGNHAYQTGAKLGTIVGTGFLFFFWACGAGITGLLVVLTRGERSYVEPDRDKRPCPFCAEPIRPEAKVCPHCRSSLPTADFAFERDFPEAFKGVRYRREEDGSVVMATANGPRRFGKWQDFWQTINDVVAPDASPTGDAIVMKNPTLGKSFGNRNRSANPRF